MTQLKQNPLIGVETANSSWNWLYRVAGVAALIVGIIFRRDPGAEEIVKSER